MKKAIGEIVDRYTICKLKSERTNVNDLKEINSLLNEIKKYKGLEPYIDALYKLNGDVWDIEGDIRCGNENVLGLEEVGRRALHLRKMNTRRVDIKNQINLRYKEGYIDVKVNHGSETIPSGKSVV